MSYTTHQSFIEALRDDPVLFVEEILGQTVWSRQKEILEAVRDHKYVSVAAGHNTGKTFTTACICWWYLLTHERAIVLTTAATHQQVKDVLWREIRRLYSEAVWPIGGKLMPKSPRFQLGKRLIKGFTFDKPDSVQGHHSPNVLVVFDEAQAIDQVRAWEAFSSMLSSQGAKHLAVGNPLYAWGPFAQTHEDPKWHSMNISCLEHPNVHGKRTVIDAAVTYEAVEEMRESALTGPGSVYWDTRVLGIFPSMSDGALFPKKFVDICAGIDPNKPLIPGRFIGLDVSEMGADRTVAAVMIDGRCVELRTWNRTRAMDTCKRVAEIAISHQVPFENVNYDAVGPVGGEITKCFGMLGFPANPVYSGQDPMGDWDFLFSGERKMMFRNRRAELHWVLRCLMEHELISIPQPWTERFRLEACQLQYGFFDDGRLYVESKKNKYIPRTGFSPDHSDAVVLSLARNQCSMPSLTVSGADVPGAAEKFDPKGSFRGD